MITNNKAQVLDRLFSTKIVPVFYHSELDICRNILKSCYDAGVHIFEFTNRGANAYDIFVDLRNYANNFLPGMLLGIGSIIDKATTEKFILAGADFVVSPILRPEMGEMCRFYNRIWIPGCLSLTEMVDATQSGADVVKLFPASTMGAAYLKAILAPLPNLKIMPTGGIDPSEQNLNEWLGAGAKCIGLEGKFFKQEYIDARNFDAIKEDLKAAYTIAQSFKK